MTPPILLRAGLRADHRQVLRPRVRALPEGAVRATVDCHEGAGGGGSVGGRNKLCPPPARAQVLCHRRRSPRGGAACPSQDDVLLSPTRPPPALRPQWLRSRADGERAASSFVPPLPCGRGGRGGACRGLGKDL
eukprot:189477-Hanusia_phi.AAC.3